MARRNEAEPAPGTPEAAQRDWELRVLYDAQQKGPRKNGEVVPLTQKQVNAILIRARAWQAAQARTQGAQPDTAASAQHQPSGSKIGRGDVMAATVVAFAPWPVKIPVVAGYLLRKGIRRWVGRKLDDKGILTEKPTKRRTNPPPPTSK